MMRASLIVLVASLLTGKAADNWRQATEAELKETIPARAQVETERIETEFRTASGITDGKGKFVAGVVLITAGYAAEGKYSNFVIVQSPVKIETLVLEPGTYVFGWRHSSDDALQVTFYEADSGKLLGKIAAARIGRVGRIDSFHISTPAEGSQIRIGRFAMPYEMVAKKR